MFTKEEAVTIEQYLNDMPANSSVYIGADSVKRAKAFGGLVILWRLSYTLAQSTVVRFSTPL